jgi:hypothetical protein
MTTATQNITLTVAGSHKPHTFRDLAHIWGAVTQPAHALDNIEAGSVTTAHLAIFGALCTQGFKPPRGFDEFGDTSWIHEQGENCIEVRTRIEYEADDNEAGTLTLTIDAQEADTIHPQITASRRFGQ